MGGRNYVSPVPWIWSDDGRHLALVARRRPLISHLVLCLVLLPGLSYGAYSLLAGRSDVNASPGALKAIFIAMPVIVTLIFVLYYWIQWRAGPWLVYDRETRELQLSRAKVTLHADRIHSVQVASGVLNQGGSNPTRVSEVNIIVLGEGATPESPSAERFPVVGTLDVQSSRDVAERLQRALREGED